MKRMEEVIKEHGHEKMIRSIVRTVGKESLKDIYNHGADAGYPGITYTTDCVNLAWKHKESIRSLIEEYAEETGDDIGAILRSWNCIGKAFKSSELVRSLYRERKPDFNNDVDNTLWNGLAWFAAEEVARWFLDE